jgi:hypothetical protein
MEERKNVTADKGDPATPKAPETPAEPDAAAENEKDKEKEPQIDIKQVPMDGVCGGY